MARLFERGNNRIHISEKNVIIVDGARIARWIPERRVLEFFDRNPVTTKARGSRFVEVDVVALLQRLNDAN